MKNLLKSIKNQAYEDNFANRNYEIAVAMLKTVDLMLNDRVMGNNNYYEMEMCPSKTPQVDAYIVCTTDTRKDYALQIKSGNVYDAKTKEYMWNCRHKYSFNPDNYVLLTWKKFRTRNGFSYEPNVVDESIVEVCDDLEGFYQDFPDEVSFVYDCLNDILESSLHVNEVNWIIINRKMAEVFNKYSLEEDIFLP